MSRSNPQGILPASVKELDELRDKVDKISGRMGL